MNTDEDCDECINRDDLSSQLQRFPEGQFVAVLHEDGREKVVGTAHTMRVNEPPYPGTWMEIIGDLGISKHTPDGEWLYGVEMAVRPNYHRRGIGTALYNARFNLCKRLNLRGWYAAGMLMGYYRYKEQLSPLEYGEKVIKGEIHDPTVSMQMNRGFRPVQVIENYIEEELAGNAAVLIVWKNPEYKEIL